MGENKCGREQITNSKVSQYVDCTQPLSQWKSLKYSGCMWVTAAALLKSISVTHDFIVFVQSIKVRRRSISRQTYKSTRALNVACIIN